jgi:hypothetical protein
VGQLTEPDVVPALAQEQGAYRRRVQQRVTDELQALEQQPPWVGQAVREGGLGQAQAEGVVEVSQPLVIGRVEGGAPGRLARRAGGVVGQRTRP